MKIDTYEDLNHVLCETLFTKDFSYLPVYVELDEINNLKIANRFEWSEDEVRKKIAEFVRNRIDQTGIKSDPLIGIYKNLKDWQKKGSQSDFDYPEIPFLLVLTFAAVDMGGEDSFDSLAYYPRLRNLLASENLDHLESSYRTYSDFIWGLYNDWLDVINKKKRGIGTAKSIGSKQHIGYPLSQALIRSGDRKKLPSLFRKHGFPAFASVVASDMESIIDEWVSAEEQGFSYTRTPSRPFRKLWEQNVARQRMCSIVCRELELWDGSVPRSVADDGSSFVDELIVRLEATKMSFPATRLNISFAVSGFSPSDNQSINVLDSEERLHSIAVSSDPSGWFRPSVGVLPITDQDLLEKSLSVQSGANSRANRAPKKVVVLRLDDLTRRYREVERIEIGVRSFILVQEFMTLTSSVRQIVKDCAREGWKENTASQLEGLPAGWILFSEVEFLQPPEANLIKNVNLEVLKPTRSGSLTFSSGLQLPGRIPKWHSAVGLEIRATFVGASKLSIEIEQIVDGEKIYSTKTDYFQPTIIHVIEKKSLPDGDFRVLVFVDDSPEPEAVKSLYLRSSDSPDQQTWKKSDRLIYNLAASAEAVLNASTYRDQDKFYIDGALPVCKDNSKLELSTRVPQSNEWWGSKVAIIDSKIKNFQLPSADRYPCFEKGNHRFLLPDAKPNKAGTGFERVEGGKITGTCEYCGLTKRSPADYWSAAKMFERTRDKKLKNISSAPIPKIDISSLPVVDHNTITRDLAFDALMHLGGGSDGYISTIASNVDPSALFRYEFVRTMEQLAHIDVTRDSTFQVAGWEINPTVIVKSLHDHFVTGYWPTNFQGRLQSHLGVQKYQHKHQDEGVARISILGTDSSLLLSTCEKLDIPATIIENPSIAILNMLPDINSVALALPAVRPGVYEEVSTYSPEQNAWIPISAGLPTKVGGYRVISNYRKQYIVVTQEDIGSDSARFVSADFAKFYCSAILNRTPLFSYRKKDAQIIVPRGAPIPGNYGRAAVMASGYLPRLDHSGRYLIYNDISLDLAELLAERLGGQ